METSDPDVKIIILGDQNVGKTSIINALLDKEDEDVSPTRLTKNFVFEHNDKLIEIWDTTADKRYIGTTRVAIKKVFSAILVISMNQTFDAAVRSLDNWYTIASDCGIHNFMVVVTQSDIQNKSLKIEQLKEYIHNQRPYYGNLYFFSIYEKDKITMLKTVVSQVLDEKNAIMDSLNPQNRSSCCPMCLLI